jgi:hypothetical protein
MKRLALTALLAAAALAAGCGRTPTAPARQWQAPTASAHDGYLGSGNRGDSSATH